MPFIDADGLPGIPVGLLQALAGAAGTCRLALVGGAVRDLLLHRVHNDPWRGVPDLDLVVEGTTGGDSGGPVSPDAGGVAAHRLARRLEQTLGPAVVASRREHGAYGTVELELRLEEGPFLLDVATARRESYPVPAENPVVGEGALEQDLARRDFSINAMALVIRDGRLGGDLLDPHGGCDDLQHRRLRFLHPHSVRDDPTRILRGARYAARLGFRLEAASLAQIRTTIARWPWRWRPGDPPPLAPPALGTRLRMELQLLLRRENGGRALAILQRWGGLELLDRSLQRDPTWPRRLRWAGRLGVDPLLALLAGGREPLALAERLQIPHRQHRLLARFLWLRHQLEGSAAPSSGEGRSPADWCALLEAPGVAPEVVALALAASVGPRRPLLRWWARWRHLRSPLSAEQLMAQGMAPGPALGQRLRQLRLEQLDRERR